MSASAAPVFKCLAANNEYTVALKSYLVRLVTASAGTALDTNRVLYQLPTGTNSMVVQQTNKAVCTQAAQAYHNAVAPGSPQISRTVAVLKIGTDRYVVVDPAEPYGEFHFAIVFNAAFTKLHAFTA